MTRADLHYVDCNATGRMLPIAKQAMWSAMETTWGNPSAKHRHGVAAKAVVDSARHSLAQLIDADPSNIIFTSGGSESANTIIRAIVEQLHPEALVVGATEHEAIRKPCEKLKKQTDLRLLKWLVDEQGRAQLNLRGWWGSSVVVALMWANNETGVLHPIHEIADLCAQTNTPLVVDATQALGRVPISFRKLAAKTPTYLFGSVHKFGGPKGIGFMAMRDDCPFCPLIEGGGQEHEKRSGTENVTALAGLDGACRQVMQLFPVWNEVATLRNQIEGLLKSRFGNRMRVAGELAQRLPNTSLCAFRGLDNRAAQLALSDLGWSVGTGSACSCNKPRKPSPVLEAMGFDEDSAAGALRFSLGLEHAPSLGGDPQLPWQLANVVEQVVSRPQPKVRIAATPILAKS